MKIWIHYILIGFEAVGFAFFFNSFLEPRNRKVIWTLYPLIYVQILLAVILTSLTVPKYGDVVKVLIIIAALFIDCISYYRTGKAAGIFFSGLNYILLFFVDSAAVSLFGMSETLQNHILWIGLRLIWIFMLYILRKSLKPIREYLREDKVPWTRFAWLPLLSGVIGIYLYFFFLSDAGPSLFYSLVSIALLCLNIISMLFMQDSLLKEEELRRSEIKIQKKENQLQMFHDMQLLYERQGKKLHDYKKQMGAVNELLGKGEIDAALKFTEQLTRSITIELSEINVGHPIINAVLNQEYRLAKEKGIGISFSISDLHDVNISDEDIVVLLGNLLENAIHECEKIIESGKKAVISFKFVKKDGKLILTIRNPIFDKVVVKDNKVVGSKQDGHGIGLKSIEDVVKKYEGDFVISSNEKEFVAVAII